LVTLRKILARCLRISGQSLSVSTLEIDYREAALRRSDLVPVKFLHSYHGFCSEAEQASMRIPKSLAKTIGGCQDHLTKHVDKRPFAASQEFQKTGKV